MLEHSTILPAQRFSSFCRWEKGVKSWLSPKATRCPKLRPSNPSLICLNSNQIFSLSFPARQQFASGQSKLAAWRGNVGQTRRWNLRKNEFFYKHILGRQLKLVFISFAFYLLMVSWSGSFRASTWTALWAGASSCEAAQVNPHYPRHGAVLLQHPSPQRLSRPIWQTRLGPRAPPPQKHPFLTLQVSQKRMAFPEKTTRYRLSFPDEL